MGGSEASPRHCHAQPAQLSDHNTVRPPRGAAPALLEVPRHRFLSGNWVWKENLLGVPTGSAEKWDLNWENCPHAPRFAKTSPFHFQSRNDQNGRKEFKHQTTHCCDNPRNILPRPDSRCSALPGSLSPWPHAAAEAELVRTGTGNRL